MHVLYAHTLQGAPESEWQRLDDHLRSCAELAKKFAKPFSSGLWAERLGWLHDAGKSRETFQSYIRHCTAGEAAKDDVYDSQDHTHSGVGACWAVEKLGLTGRILAYCVAGHHAGLPDFIGGRKPNGALNIRLAGEKVFLEEPQVRQWIECHDSLWAEKCQPPWQFGQNSTDMSFWIRMLYSCLVDADYLDTERFMAPRQADERSGYPELGELADEFESKMSDKEASAPKTQVNSIRRRIRGDCMRAADGDIGMYSLTVPTGGGKTLSATAFALRHAVKHGLKRIIYVIPYTSIIDQTAEVLRSFFGEKNVLEHHSNLDPDKETLKSKLSTENWDAPVIVTTSVQFFESLYGCRSSQCRKLHNISESVVILDEVQLLPPKLLWPCTEALAQLASHYRVTVVLSTATQPALKNVGPIRDVREIVADPDDLYRQLKRVSVEFPQDTGTRQGWEEIADELSGHSQVLCIVNTKKDARQLAQELSKRCREGVVYLSTWLCGAHRSALISEIKEKLSHGESVRVVSTQLVEAGVDLDFPVVYRAFTGLPSIAQAAGRCNREGRRPEAGKVKVFMPPKQSPRGELLKAEQVSKSLLRENPLINLDCDGIYREFFERYYDAQNDDGKQRYSEWLSVNCRSAEFSFRTASEDFKIVPDDTVSVIVRYAEGNDLIEKLREEGISVRLRRRLQRYAVSVSTQQLAKLRNSGLVEELPEGIGLFVQCVDSLYDMQYGLDLEKESLDADELVF